MADIKVGGEVDAFCTRCKMVLAHTTLAVWAGDIKRVRCNTCMGEHAYRSGKPTASATPKAPKAPRAAGTKVAKSVAEKASNYDALLAGKDRSSARRYNTKEHFEVGELIEHPTFGLGVVAAVRLDKVDVAFPSGVKTLLHLKGATTPIALPSKSKRRDIIDLPPAKDDESDEDEDEAGDEDDDVEDASEVDDE